MFLKQCLLQTRQEKYKLVKTFVLRDWNAQVLQALIIELHCNFISARKISPWRK
jgi:hypothetical protein